MWWFGGISHKSYQTQDVSTSFLANGMSLSILNRFEYLIPRYTSMLVGLANGASIKPYVKVAGECHCVGGYTEISYWFHHLGDGEWEGIQDALRKTIFINCKGDDVLSKWETYHTIQGWVFNLQHLCRSLWCSHGRSHLQAKGEEGKRVEQERERLAREGPNRRTSLLTKRQVINIKGVPHGMQPMFFIVYFSIQFCYSNS